MRSLGSNPKEKEIVRAIRRRMARTSPSAMWIKLVGGPYQQPGLPDLLGVDRGKTICVEVKTPAAFDKPQHNLSANQQDCLAAFVRAGAHVYVTDGRRWDDLTSHMLNGGSET